MKYHNYRKNDIDNKMSKLGYNPLDVLITGSTGAGKSTTLNTLFSSMIAKVGDGSEPETMYLQDYFLSNGIRLWDSPGFGDGYYKDKEHEETIKSFLKHRIEHDNNYGFVDMVILILEAGTRDMGTAFNLINNIILPNLKDSKRLIIGLNQSDFAMKGKGWDNYQNKPLYDLKLFLEEKKESIKNRIYSSTGIKNINIMDYSALKDYKTYSFLDMIIDNIPINKRYML